MNVSSEILQIIHESNKIFPFVKRKGVLWKWFSNRGFWDWIGLYWSGQETASDLMLNHIGFLELAK